MEGGAKIKNNHYKNPKEEPRLPTVWYLRKTRADEEAAACKRSKPKDLLAKEGAIEGLEVQDQDCKKIPRRAAGEGERVIYGG